MFHPPARNGGKLYYTGYFPEWEEGFCFCCLPAAGGFFAGPVVQGPGEVLAETCQTGNSTPRFLAAQRSAVSSRREEIAFVALAAQHNKRVCGPFWNPMGSRHAVPDQ